MGRLLRFLISGSCKKKPGISREMPSGATPCCSDLSSGGVVTLLHSIILDVQISDLRLLQKKPGISREVLGSEHVWTESNSAQI